MVVEYRAVGEVFDILIMWNGNDLMICYYNDVYGQYGAKSGNLMLSRDLIEIKLV